MKSIVVKIALICSFSLLAANVSEAEFDEARMPSGPAIHGPKPVKDAVRADKGTELDTSWLAKVQQGIATQEYHAGINPKGLQAPNRAHNLRIYFDTTGIRVVDRTAKANPTLLGLSTVSLGRREADSAKVSGGALFHEKNRVEIRRSGFTEWYLNSAGGLEQGFNISKRPEGNGELRLAVGVTRARAQKQGDTVILTTPGGRRLEYGALKARDAAGRILPARLAVPSSDRIVMIVDDRNARYPIVIDPLLTGMDDNMVESNQAGARMGNSVASAGDVNGDGYADVIVGAYWYDNGYTDEGAAFVFLGGPAGITGTDPLTAHAALVGNQAGAWMGDSVAPAGDVNGDGYADVIVGAPQYDNGENGEGAAFVFLGGASGITGTDPSTAHAALEGNQAGARMGDSVASAGDVNGDGYADVIAGAPMYSYGENEEGAAFVFLGGASGITGTDPSTAHAALESNRAGARMGNSVAPAGDVNGDGYADVIVGAYWYENGHSYEGAAFVFLGGASGLTGTDPSTAHAALESNQAAAYMGQSVASAGDVNGDGYADVIVGADGYDNGQDGEGAAFVFLGGPAGLTGTGPLNAHAFLESNLTSAYMGQSVASAGDVNGDGYADVIVGAPYYDKGESAEGAAFVYLGGASGITGTDPSNAHAVLEGNQASAQMGRSVAPAGDVNGDGYADVIVGAFTYDSVQTDEGAAFVFLGGAAGITGTEPSNANAVLEGNQGFAYMGYSVAAAGDVNGDGYADVIVGASGYDNGQTNEGAAFVYLGGASGITGTDPSNANAVLEANQDEAGMGYSVAAAGDVNGDGYADVIVGAINYDNGQTDEGAAFVFLGSAAGIKGTNPLTAHAVLEANQDDAWMGCSVAAAGDVNGDGYADVIVGAYEYASGQIKEGAAFVYLGGASGITGTDPSTAHAVLESNQAYALMGWSVASAGDVNGDGYADVIVGAISYDNGDPGEGAAFVFLGGAAGLTGSDPSTADAILESNQNIAGMGWSVASAGDVNGDGYADVIVGADGYDKGQDNEGAAFVFLGGAAGITGTDPSTAHAVFESNQANSHMGYSVGSAGDVNGDGYADVIVGDWGYTNGELGEGAAFVFLGGASGLTGTDPSTAHAVLEGNQRIACMSYSVGSAGDVNGDGYSDVIVGAMDYANGQTYEGAAFVYYGNGGITGKPVLARQWTGDGARPVPRVGLSRDDSRFVVSMQAFAQGVYRQVKLQVEACPAGSPWGDVDCVTATSADWTAVTAADLPAGVTLEETLTGLAPDTVYHWRARTLFGPDAYGVSGITPCANPAHGPWRRFDAQPAANDIRIGVAAGAGGSQGGGGGGSGGCFISIVQK